MTHCGMHAQQRSTPTSANPLKHPTQHISAALLPAAPTHPSTPATLMSAGALDACAFLPRTAWPLLPAADTFWRKSFSFSGSMRAKDASRMARLGACSALARCSLSCFWTQEVAEGP